MNKILSALSIALFASIGASAQYYYKDIISNKQATSDMAKYKENKIRSIKIKSFEDDGSPSEGFFGERKNSKDFRKSELFTRTSVSEPSLLTTQFDENGKLIRSNDSSSISTSNTWYDYDADGRLKKVTTSIRSTDDDFINEILEEHIYIYGNEFMPEKMIRVKNHTDSITILFSLDENNNISIEKDTRNGSKYYYYYDAKSKLTDIAHSNDFKPKLVADYIFQYDYDGNIAQLTTTEEASNNYFIWKYSYDNGLRTSEKLYSKDRKLMGSIEYEYRK
jgi:YD repeat-containing protein